MDDVAAKTTGVNPGGEVQPVDSELWLVVVMEVVGDLPGFLIDQDGLIFVSSEDVRQINKDECERRNKN